MTPPTLKITWIKWDKGDTWEQGIQGEQWIQWEQGIQWEVWPKGDKGDKWEKGLDGLDGIDWVSPVLDYEKIAKKLPKEDITPKIISEIKKLNKDTESKGLDVKDLKGGKELIKEVKSISQFWQISTEYRVNWTKVADGNNLNLKAGNGVTLSWVPTSNGAEITITNSQSGAVWWQITGTLSDQTDLQTALNAKQATLVSGTNIKTINSTSLLGSGNIDISAAPGGSTTQIQFNDAGAFGGDAWFTYNKTTDTVSVTKTSLGATPTAGLQVINSTAATVWTPSQVSPSFLRKGNGFFSNSSTSFPFEVQDYVSGDTNIIAYWKHIWQYRANSGSWAEFMSFSTAPLGLGFSITPWQSLSNGTPGTTRNMTINNTGTNSWIDWKFSGVAKSYLGADSSGAMKFYAGGGSYFEYYQMAGGSLFSYNYPTAFVHSWNGLFGWSVNAGSQSTPTSTLQSQWSFATKGRRVTSNYTLTTTDSVVYADATTPTCNGTPSASCASWTNQTDCEKWDAHGGCSWFAGSPCSDYNWNQSECEWHSGCTYETASCSVYNGDESTCSGTSGCSWGGNDCSPLDEWTCGSTSGCSTNYSACSWDWMTCTGGAGCDGYFMSPPVTLHFTLLGVLGHIILVLVHTTLVLVRERTEQVVVVLLRVLVLMTQRTVVLRQVVVGLHLLQ